MPFSTVFAEVLRLWGWIAGVVYALVTGTVLVAVLVNQEKWRKNHPFQTAKNTPLELTYAVLLAVVAGALVYGSWVANTRLHDGQGLAEHSGPAPAVRLRVTAYRWCWDFGYQVPRVRRTGDCRTGDFPTAIVPAGQPVQFDITSQDVVHAFWLPDFAVKRDAYPDHDNTLRMVFPKPGRWRGRCSEYCGTHHVTMDFYVQAVPPDEYQRFVHSGGVST